MSYEQLKILVDACGVILFIILTCIIKPFIESRVSETTQKQLENYIRIGVRCAEQIYSPEEWKDKKEYVTRYVTSLIGSVINIELTPSQLDTLIEGFVYQLKQREDNE